LPAWLGRPILTRAVGGARAGKVPSLRIHVRSAARDGAAPEPTEVLWMNGAVARAGAELGVPTPVNGRLTALVEDVAANLERRTWLRGHPERLLAELADAGQPARGTDSGGPDAHAGPASHRQ
jgi:2-dehydropantoate 2-reductase